MATDYRAKGYQSGIGALIEGLSSGSDDWAKNKFKRNQEIEKRRFDIAKMIAQDEMIQNRSNATFDRNQEQKLQQEFPDQYMPRRATTEKFLSPEDLAKANQFYRGISDERSRRLKVKEENQGKKGSLDQILAEILSKNQK